MTAVTPSLQKPPHPGPVFVAGTGTDAGKTVLSLALTGYARARGHRMIALKPFETGCDPRPADADQLAAAAGDPSLADDPAFYRVQPALGPLAVTLRGAAPPPDLTAIAAACRARLPRAAPGLVEGAGGLMVPLTEAVLVADLVADLGLPVVLVAPDRLGVQSHVLAAVECAQRRGLSLLAVVLNQVDPTPDDATHDNGRVLASLLPCPVTHFAHQATHAPTALARALDPRLTAALAW